MPERPSTEAHAEATLHHTHLMASDIDATIGFWVDCFGGRVVADLDLAGVRNVLMEVGRGRLNLYDQPPNHRGVVNHLGVQVADVAATVATLTEAGWAPRQTKEDEALSYAMVQGPDELLIEVFRFDPETTEPALRPYFDLPPLPRTSDRALPADRPVHGAGELSAPAMARLAEPTPGPLEMPDAGDAPAVARWRTEIHNRWLAGDPTPHDLGYQETTVDGVRCLEANPDGVGATVVYVHGGGFCLGSPEVALPITSRLTSAADADNLRLCSVDYRLAPEHPYPAAVDDVAAVVRAIANRRPADPVVLVGDSAGANIALAVATRLPAETPLAGLALLSPHLDLRAHEAERQAVDPRSDLDADGSKWLNDAYRGDLPADDPQISPLLADLASLPPLLIQAGTRDNTMPAAIRLARRARTAGITVTLDLWDGLWHAWQYHRDLPEADAALAEVRRFIHDCVAGAAVP